MQLTKSEWMERLGTPEFQDELALAIRTEGYVMLEEFFERDRIKIMRDDFAELLSAHRVGTVDGRGANRYNIGLPAREPFVSPDIQTNEALYPLIKQLVGDDAAITFLTADTPLKGSEYQKAHADGFDLFPGVSALPIYNLVLNIMLVDFTLENGPLEVYPNGTHLLNWRDAVAASDLMEPRQVTGPAGSVVLRDARMWHRGTPNTTDDMRPMMAVVYCRSWYRFAEADAGKMATRVDAQTYRSWDAEIQRLFRFADVEDSANAPVVSSTATEKIAAFLT